MHFREWLMDVSLGSGPRLCWRIFRLREGTGSRLTGDILTLLPKEFCIFL